MSQPATADVWSMPPDAINVGEPHLFEDDTWGPYFERLRRDDPVNFTAESAMDPPRHDGQRHDGQRKVVGPIVAPGNLANMAGIIRERAGRILDGLPRNETFDWVDRVAVELTTQMLATLFDYPFEDRRQLPHRSNVAVGNIRASIPVSSMASHRCRFEFRHTQHKAEVTL